MAGGQWGGRDAARLTALTLATHGTICHLCGRPGANTADHLVARSHGGGNELDNLRPAHSRCNSKRGNMSMVEWRKRYPIRASRAEPSRDW